MYDVRAFKTIEGNKTVYAVSGDIGKHWKKYKRIFIEDVLRWKKAKLSEADKYEVLEGRIKDAGNQWELYEGNNVKGTFCLVVRRKENTKNG